FFAARTLQNRHETPGNPTRGVNPSYRYHREKGISCRLLQTLVACGCSSIVGACSASRVVRTHRRKNSWIVLRGLSFVRDSMAYRSQLTTRVEDFIRRHDGRLVWFASPACARAGLARRRECLSRQTGGNPESPHPCIHRF